MPTPSFIEQIPEEFRKNRMTLQFVQALFFRLNRTIEVINEQEIQLQNSAFLIDSLQDQITQNQEQEQFTEITLNPGGVTVAISGAFYVDAADPNSATAYGLLLPSFPETDFYCRAQIFGTNTVFVFVNDNSRRINGTNSVTLSGDGSVVDIRYSVTLDRYVLT